MMRLAVALVCTAALSPAASPESLRIAVVQMSLGPTLEANRDRIVAWIPKAAARRARVVVFPEGALSGRGDAPEGDVPEAVRAIRAAAAASQVYVLFGGWTWNDRLRRTANWMKVVDPDGRELLHYDKLWDVHDAATPGLFLLDGVPASAIICADRWLRGIEDLPVQQGAQISFELSNNFASEWVPDLGWYWYVPRALRNGAYVVFANTANRTPGHPEAGVNQGPRHGHSAVIAPDGTIASSVLDDLEKLLIVDLDLSKATRAEAIRRRTHPALSRFWQTGLELMNVPGSTASPLSQVDSPAIDLHVAAGQIADGDFAAMEEMIRKAGRQKVDIIAFAAFAEDGADADSAVHRIREASRQASVATAFALGDTAYVIGPDADLLTRHRRLSAGGTSLSTMWFRVKGVPAVVSLGPDALWNELAELAAVAGARLHVNLAREQLPDSRAVLRCRQIGAVLSSYQTITVMANTTHSAIWDDLTAREETRAAVRGTSRPGTEEVRVFSPFSANLAVEAGESPGLITLRRRIPGRNDYYPGRTARYHPAMDRWYVLGAQLLSPEW